MITETNNWQLWHYRLGHLSTQNMKKLITKDVKLSQIQAKQEFCESCAISKAKKQPHKEICKNEESELNMLLCIQIS